MSHLGPAAMAARSSGKLDVYGRNSQTSGSSKQPCMSGLVIMDPHKDPSAKGVSKHISRMVESSSTNERFRNLMKVKVADREKDRAEKEYGSRPEEFVTSAYTKQREESIKFGKELAEMESKGGKRDVTNMFRHMLGSGSYVRSNYKQSGSLGTAVNTDNSRSSNHIQVDKNTQLEPSVEVPKALVSKVLGKIVPESARGTEAAIEQKAQTDAFRIIQQIEAVAETANRDDNIQSAKERYLQRKRQRLQADQE